MSGRIPARCAAVSFLGETRRQVGVRQAARSTIRLAFPPSPPASSAAQRCFHLLAAASFSLKDFPSYARSFSPFITSPRSIKPFPDVGLLPPLRPLAVLLASLALPPTAPFSRRS